MRGMKMSLTVGFVAALLAAGAWLSRDALFAAVPPDAKCQADKLKAAGKKTSSLMKCHSKAAAEGGIVDATCVTTAEEKFLDAFSKAEAKAAEAGGQCETLDDAAASEATVDAFVADVALALAGGPSKCLASKLSATGSTAQKRLNLYAKDKKKPGPERLAESLQKNDGPLDRKFEAAETTAAQREGGCPTLDDASAIDEKIHDFVAAVSANLYPWPETSLPAASIDMAHPPEMVVETYADSADSSYIVFSTGVGTAFSLDTLETTSTAPSAIEWADEVTWPFSEHWSVHFATTTVAGLPALRDPDTGTVIIKNGSRIYTVANGLGREEAGPIDAGTLSQILNSLQLQ
jgi:hypothetical protein